MSEPRCVAPQKSKSETLVPTDQVNWFLNSVSVQPLQCWLLMQKKKKHIRKISPERDMWHLKHGLSDQSMEQIIKTPNLARLCSTFVCDTRRCTHTHTLYSLYLGQPKTGVDSRYPALKTLVSRWIILKSDVFSMASWNCRAGWIIREGESLTRKLSFRELPSAVHRGTRLWLQGIHFPQGDPPVHVPGRPFLSFVSIIFWPGVVRLQWRVFSGWRFH